MTDKYLDCRVLKKLKRQAWHFNISLYAFFFFNYCKFLLPFRIFQKSLKKTFLLLEKHANSLYLKIIEGT